jgi:hypothetical protein
LLWAALSAFATTLNLDSNARIAKVQAGVVVHSSVATLKTQDELQVLVTVLAPARPTPTVIDTHEVSRDNETDDRSTEEWKDDGNSSWREVVESNGKETLAQRISSTAREMMLPLSLTDAELLATQYSSADAALSFVFDHPEFLEPPSQGVIHEQQYAREPIPVRYTVVTSAGPVSTWQAPTELIIARDNAQPGLEKDVFNNVIEMRLNATVQQVQEALKRCSSVEAAMQYIMPDLLVPTEELTVTCPILLVEYPVSQMFTLDCKKAHKFSVDGMIHHVRQSLQASNTQAPHIPACPLSSDGSAEEACRHLITATEIQQLWKLYKDLKHLEGERVDDVALDREANTLSEQIVSLQNLKTKKESGYVRCPNCEGSEDDGFWFERSDVTVRECVRCPMCHATFCSQCLRAPYHYRVNCEDVLSQTTEWAHWMNTGRQQYLDQIAAADRQYRELLQQFNTKREEHEQDAKSAVDRLAELQQTEQWKAQNCKRCPTCGRTVEKLDGCDLMKCGQDYHGGNVQNGCGASFRWTQVGAY